MSGYRLWFSGSADRMALGLFADGMMVAGGHLGMMALSRVTVASARLSCSRMQAASMLLWSGRPYKQSSLSGLTPLHSPRNTKARFLRL